MKAREIYSAQEDQNCDLRWSFAVGCDGVTSIEHEVENYGDHGLAWFHIKRGDVLWQSVSAKTTGRVVWDEPEVAPL
jgi:hypothetical protein